MRSYKVRLIDTEGRVWAEFVTPTAPDILEAAVMPKLHWKKVEELDPVALAIHTVQFKYEQTAGDGVLIYRRITPLWS